MLDVQLTDVAIPFPNLNVVALPRPYPLPVTVTGVPPACDAAFGPTLTTVGFPNVKWSLLVTPLSPLGVMMRRSTVPVVSGGETAVIEVAEWTS